MLQTRPTVSEQIALPFYFCESPAPVHERVTTVLNQAWDGAQLSVNLRVTVSWQDNELVFSIANWAHTSANGEKSLGVPSSSVGRFVEGLWDGEVVELFIASPHDRGYQEIHLTPRGEWWSCYFSDYRVRAWQPEPDSAIVAPCTLPNEKDYWQLSLRMPPRALRVDCAANTALEAHISAILGGENKIYLTSSIAHSREQMPDFHQRACFRTVSWWPLQK